MTTRALKTLMKESAEEQTGDQPMCACVYFILYKRLVKVENLTIGTDLEKPAQSATGIVNQMEIFIPLSGLININQEVERLEKQIADFNGRLRSVNGKLNNENFVARAPKDVVANEKRKQGEYLASIQKLEENLNSLKA